MTIWPARAAVTAVLRRGGERFGVGDGGVCGHDPQHVVGVFLRREDAGDRHRRCAVAADQLEQDARLRDAGIAQLLGDDEAVVVVDDHDRGGEPAADRPTGGFLQQGLLREERPELFRIGFSRDRPEPRAGAAGQDNRHDRAGDRGEGSGGGGGHGNSWWGWQAVRFKPGSSGA